MHMFVLSNHQAYYKAYLFQTFFYSVMFGKLPMDPSILKMRLLHKSWNLHVISAPDIYGVSLSP